jgi:hypothetical protein
MHSIERRLTENGPLAGAIFSYAWRPPFAPVIVSRGWNQYRRDNLVERYPDARRPPGIRGKDGLSMSPRAGAVHFSALFVLARAAFQHEFRSCRCFIGTLIAILRLPPSC